MDQRRFRKLIVMSILVIALSSGLAATAETEFARDPLSSHDVRPGAGVTHVGCMSDYNAALHFTPIDTRVYYLESGEPGPTALILGGTHANEIAGVMAATLIIERAVVTAGRIIVVPYANNSAACQSDSTNGGPEWYYIQTPSGLRKFKYGDRRTSVSHQGKDPARYIHYPSGKALSGNSARDLNRVYPGKLNGNLTEKLAWAYMQLIKSEAVTIAIDLHEAGTASKLANTIVANPKNLDYAVMAVLDGSLEGCNMNVDASAPNSPGLSHREWGDATRAAAYLIETPNPGQYSGAVNADVVTDPANPLAARVGTHLTAIEAIFAAHELIDGGRPEWTGIPARGDLVERGLGSYLR